MVAKNASFCKLLAKCREPQQTPRVVKTAAKTKRMMRMRQAKLCWYAQHARHRRTELRYTSHAATVIFSARTAAPGGVVTAATHGRGTRTFVGKLGGQEIGEHVWHARHKHRNRKPCNQQPRPAQTLALAGDIHSHTLSLIHKLTHTRTHALFHKNIHT